MDISKLAPAEAIEAVTAMDTVEQLREAATSINVSFSGNTGEGTLRKKITDTLEEKAKEEADTNPTTPENQVENPDPSELFAASSEEDNMIQKPVIPEKKKAPTIAELIEMDPNEIEDRQLLRQVVRARALRLKRVRITNLDPSDAQLNGAIVTVSNQYTGKVSKYVPFGDEGENGYHLPMIILNHLKSQKFALRKEKKGNQFGVKQYTTKMVNKYSIEELPPLTKKELDELGARQRASSAIDG